MNPPPRSFSGERNRKVFYGVLKLYFPTPLINRHFHSSSYPFSSNPIFCGLFFFFFHLSSKGVFFYLTPHSSWVFTIEYKVFEVARFSLPPPHDQNQTVPLVCHPVENFAFAVAVDISFLNSDMEYVCKEKIMWRKAPRGGGVRIKESRGTG